MEYSQGIYFNKKHEKAPEFVLGSLSIRKQSFLDWLGAQPADEKGYVRLKISDGKDGKPYIAVDDWKPGQERKPKTEPKEDPAVEMSGEDDINPDDIPW